MKHRQIFTHKPLSAHGAQKNIVAQKLNQEVNQEASTDGYCVFINLIILQNVDAECVSQMFTDNCILFVFLEYPLLQHSFHS